MLRRLSLAALAGAAALAVPGVASAAQTVDVKNTTIASATESLGTYSLSGYDPLGVSKWNVAVESKASWSAGLQTHIGWDTANVRQGAPLTITRSMPLASGTIRVSWKVSGSVYVGKLGGSFASKTLAVDASCMPRTLGSGYDCTADSPALYLLKSPGLPGSPYAKLLIRTRFSITPEGIITNRTFGAGSDSQSAQLPLTQAINSETLKVPCAPVGTHATYRLNNPHYTPTVSAIQLPVIAVGLMDPMLGVVETPALYEGTFGPSIKANPTFDLTGSSIATDLGGILANNVKPTITLPDNFTGTAGTPVSFNATTTSRCDIESYVWRFSNGTTSYGKSPVRAFPARGVYDGELTVTDVTGQKAVRNFTVTIR